MIYFGFQILKIINVVFLTNNINIFYMLNSVPQLYLSLNVSNDVTNQTSIWNVVWHIKKYKSCEVEIIYIFIL